MTSRTEEDEAEARRKISVFGRDYTMPRSRRMRVAIGVSLVILGMFGFLPVLGFWMIPLGLLVLSYEYARVRRMRRRTAVWWGNRRGRGANGRVVRPAGDLDRPGPDKTP